MSNSALIDNNPVIKCVIIEDDPITISVLSKLIEGRKDIELIQSFSDPMKAIDKLNLMQPDLLFIDIEMPGMTGIELVKKLKFDANFIFVSAHPSYAIEGFNLNAVDFIEKPVESDRFDQAIEKLKVNLSNTLDGYGEPFMFLKENNKYHKVMFKDIMYIKSDTDYLQVYTRSQRFVLLHTLKTMQEKLRKFGFIKVHKSYIVDKSKIESIDRDNHVLIIEDLKIPFSRRMKRSIYEALNIKPPKAS